MSPKERPHVVFFLSDQHNASIMGNAGDPYVRTPNMDRLASEGVRFSNIYCTSPLCVPSRSSMLSGLLPMRTGIFNNFQCLRSDEPTFVHSLSIAGYNTVLCGRMHFRGPDQRHGFSERLVGDISSPEIGYEIQELGELQGGADQHRVSIEKSGPGHSIVIDYDTTVVRSACNFLQNYDYKKPLFLMIGLFGPHCPFVCSENLYTYYNDVLPEPDDFTDIKRNIHPAIAKWYEYREVREVPIERVHAARSAYYGLIECTDSYLGEIMNTIEQTLGFEHTLVIYSSDHGDMIGDKGLFWKTNFYEGSARVPLLMRYPGKISGGSHIQQPATLMDIGPTISDFCKADHLPQRDGESLFPVLSGSQDQQDERAIISQLGDVKGDTPSVMVRKGPWKLVDHVGYEAPQLFDIFSDSDELDDLGDEPDFRDIIHDLRNELSGKWDGQYVAKQVELAKSVIPIMRKASWDKNPEHISEWWRGEKDRNFITR